MRDSVIWGIIGLIIVLYSAAIALANGSISNTKAWDLAGDAFGVAACILMGFHNLRWEVLKKLDGKYYGRNLFRWHEIKPDRMFLVKKLKYYDKVK